MKNIHINEFLIKKIPWEKRERLGIKKAFFYNLKEIIFKPKIFFSKLNTEIEWKGILFYILIIIFFSGIFDYLWDYFLNISIIIGIKDPKSESQMHFADFLFSQGIKLFEFIVISTFVNIFLVIFNFAKIQNLNINIKILVYSYSPMIFSFFPIIGKIVGEIWFYLLIIFGIKTIYKRSYINTIIIVFLSFLFLEIIYGISAFILSFLHTIF